MTQVAKEESLLIWSKILFLICLLVFIILFFLFNYSPASGHWMASHLPIAGQGWQLRVLSPPLHPLSLSYSHLAWDVFCPKHIGKTECICNIFVHISTLNFFLCKFIKYKKLKIYIDPFPLCLWRPLQKYSLKSLKLCAICELIHRQEKGNNLQWVLLRNSVSLFQSHSFTVVF